MREELCSLLDPLQFWMTSGTTAQDLFTLFDTCIQLMHEQMANGYKRH